MNRFHVGNVIKVKEGDVCIVTKTDGDGIVIAIPVAYESCEIIMRDKTYQELEWCDCGEFDCEYCNEDKPYYRTYYGAEDSEFIAPTVKDWIVKSLTKGFGF